MGNEAKYIYTYVSGRSVRRVGGREGEGKEMGYLVLILWIF